MTRRLLFIPSLLIIAFQANSQNLVPNPGFEMQTDCPLVSEIELAPPWNSANLGTPDLFNDTCATQNSAGHTGIGSAGVFIIGSFDDNREYLQAPLTAPLQAGVHYCVSAWVKPGNFRFAADRFGFYFAQSESSAISTGVMPVTPQVQNPPGNVLASASWQQVSGSFTASGGEAWLIMGSFHNDASTTTQIFNASSTAEVAYYYIDDVSVTQCFVGIGEGDLGSFEIFPQPATDRVSIRVPQNRHIQRIELFDMNGRLLHKEDSPVSQGGLVDLDVAAVHAGMHHLIMHTDKGVASRRIAIVR